MIQVLVNFPKSALNVLRMLTQLFSSDTVSIRSPPDVTCLIKYSTSPMSVSAPPVSITVLSKYCYCGTNQVAITTATVAIVNMT